MRFETLEDADQYLARLVGPQLVFSVNELSTLLGEKPQTIRNKIANGSFYIQTDRLGGRRTAMRGALVEFLFAAFNGNPPPRKRRGRPRKI